MVFGRVIRKNGQDIEWYKRVEQEADPETGDLKVGSEFEASHTIKAIVEQASMDEVSLDPGFTVNDFIRIFTTSEIQHKDKVIVNGETYEVGPPTQLSFKGDLLCVLAVCKRMIT